MWLCKTMLWKVHMNLWMVALCVTILQSLVAIGIVVVEMCFNIARLWYSSLLFICKAHSMPLLATRVYNNWWKTCKKIFANLPKNTVDKNKKWKMKTLA